MSSLGQWDGFDETPSGGTNRSAPVRDCQTCGGDRFVTVRLRSPETTMWMQEHGLKARTDQFHEEVAPCPSCNAGMTVEYWIPGHHFRSMDAAQTRQAMAQ